MQLKQLFVALVGLILCGSQLVVEAKSKWENVLDKLQASSRRFLTKPTGLNYDDYQAAYTELKASMSPAQIEEKCKESPLFRLFHDFVLLPMDLMQLSADDDEVIKGAYVRRMEQTCRRFWSAYKYGHNTDSLYQYNGVKFFHFTKALQKLTPEEPTLEMWHQAFSEYSAVKGKIEEIIRYEDVYDHLDELELKMNYLHDLRVKYVMDLYSERLNKCKTTEDMQPMVDDFRKHFDVQ